MDFGDFTEFLGILHFLASLTEKEILEPPCLHAGSEKHSKYKLLGTFPRSAGAAQGHPFHSKAQKQIVKSKESNGKHRNHGILMYPMISIQK